MTRPRKLDLLPGLPWSGTLTVLSYGPPGYLVDFDAVDPSGRQERHVMDRAILSPSQLHAWTGWHSEHDPFPAEDRLMPTAHDNEAPKEVLRYTIDMTDEARVRILGSLTQMRSSHRCEMFDAKRRKSDRVSHFESEAAADQAIWDKIVEGPSRELKDITDPELARLLGALEYRKMCDRHQMLDMEESGDESGAAHYKQELEADQVVWQHIVDRFYAQAMETD